MMNPLKYLIRCLVMSRNRSTAAHCILPLSKITCATVLMDASAPDAEATSGAVKQFFDYQNVRLRLYKPSPRDLNIAGCLKRSYRGEPLPASETELFISLLDNEDNFLSDYESSHSTAAFKVGRRQLSGNVFDMVITSPAGEVSSQSAVFAAVKDYLSKIR